MRRLRCQQGFALVTVMLSMLIVALFAVGAWSAATGDIPLARQDQDRKLAYEAAQAGADWYTFQLTRDPTYWTRCDAVPPIGPEAPAPVNQAWDGTGPDPRTWRRVGSSSAEYTVELIPKSGQPGCNTADPSATMLEGNTIRIRATGRMRGKKRSIVATFKRRGFLDFVYFTHFETLDPVAYTAFGRQDWAAANCAKFRRDGRSGCLEIQFATGDGIRGPLHTNDDILVCGSPVFGRNSGDRVEMSGPAPGWRDSCTGSTPSFRGTRVAPADELALPPSNVALRTAAEPTWRLSGARCLQFGPTKITVSTWSPPGRNCTNPVSRDYPANGVIYVSNATCGVSYDYFQDYDNPAGCGDVWVSGTYTSSVTVGAENDIVVAGDLRKSGDALAGLVANNFVRVYHRVGSRTSGGGCTTLSTERDFAIDAAIMSLQHSFLVDNYYCGGPLGTLRVNGIIAQRFRGPVGATGGGGQGYLKDYVYDDRMRYAEPPSFIDPVQASWAMLRASEQVPPR